VSACCQGVCADLNFSHVCANLIVETVSVWCVLSECTCKPLPRNVEAIDSERGLLGLV